MKTWILFELIVISMVCFANALAINTKIVGGQQVNIQNYPYQVSMEYNGRHICGGAILNTKFVVTAAHCTDKMSATRLAFRAGSSTRMRAGQVVKAKTIQQHPKFANIDYDVSVVEIVPKFIYNNQVKNIAIAAKEPGQGTQVTTSGWGTLRDTSNRLSSELRAVEIPIVDRTRCAKAYSGQSVAITDRMICAGLLYRGGKDSCQGDSGGPLVANGKLVGIVSWGYGCGRRRYPGVYTNLNNKEIKDFVKRISGV